jgi:hypothetical protein
LKGIMKLRFLSLFHFLRWTVLVHHTFQPWHAATAQSNRANSSVIKTYKTVNHNKPFLIENWLS